MKMIKRVCPRLDYIYRFVMNLLMRQMCCCSSYSCVAAAHCLLVNPFFGEEMSEAVFFPQTLWGCCPDSDGDLLPVWLKKGPVRNQMVSASNHGDNCSTGCNHQWQYMHVCVRAWLWLSGLLNLSLNATKARIRVRDPGGILLMTTRGELQWDSGRGLCVGSCVAMVTERQSACFKETEEYLLTLFLQFEPNTQNHNAEN